MQIHQLALSFTVEEIRTGLKMGLEKAKDNPQMSSQLGGLSDPDLKVENGSLVFSVKKRIALIPTTLSATVKIRAMADGNGLELTLEKINMGPMGGAAVVGPIMQQLAMAVMGRPGLSVSGNSLLVTKDALAAVPNLRVTGSIKSIDVFSDQIAIVIG